MTVCIVEPLQNQMNPTVTAVCVDFSGALSLFNYNYMQLVPVDKDGEIVYPQFMKYL